MPHRIENLQAALAELEAELQQVDAVDDDTRRLLEDAAAEIQSILERNRQDALQSEGLIESLRTAEQKFETSHPTISGILLRLVDSLAQLGI